MKTKQNPAICCLKEIHLKFWGHRCVENKRIEKIPGNQKKDCVAMLTSDKTGFKAETLL